MKELRPLVTLAASLLLHGAFAGGMLAGAQRAAQRPVLSESWAASAVAVETLPADESPPADTATGPQPAPAPPVETPETGWVPAPRPAPAARAEPSRKERPRRPKRRRHQVPPPPAGSTAPIAASPGADAGAGAGASSLPAGVRSLSKAFTRAIPAAAPGDLTWAERPAGDAGRVTVTLVVDAEGRVAETRFEHPPSPELERLVRRSVSMLGAGRFALMPGDVTAGSETLEIRVRLTDGPPPDEDTDGRDAVALSFDAPGPNSPGHASFTLASGRRFDATVTVKKSQPDPQTTPRR